MNELHENIKFPLPCYIIAPDGYYESVCYGIFQYSDKDGSRPTATVMLRTGRLGNVRVEIVMMQEPPKFITHKDGTRSYIDHEMS
jgi:hypothetical protein